MYCPHCAARISEAEARFCRGCGEDLRLVSQAVSRRLSVPMYLASRIDDFMASRRDKEERDTGMLFICYGLLTIVAAILNIPRRAFDGFSAILFMSSFLALWIGVKHAWVHWRKKSGEYHPVEISDDSAHFIVLKLDSSDTTHSMKGKATGELSRLPKLLDLDPPSVTEDTTRRLGILLESQDQ